MGGNQGISMLRPTGVESFSLSIGDRPSSKFDTG